MIEMKECKFKKRLQFYIDGWLDERESKIFDEHLKRCAQCQMEMAEIEDVNSASLNIIDQAPEKEYWDSFAVRVRNRIVSRDAVPAESAKKSPSFLGFRFVAVFMAVLAISSITLIISRFETKTPAFTTAARNAEAPQNMRQDQADLPGAVSHASLMPNNAAPETQMESDNSPDVTSSAEVQSPEMPPKVINKDNQNPLLVIKDLNSEFNSQPLIGKAKIKLNDNPLALADILGPDHSNDRGLRLHISILNERLLSGLSQTGLGAIAELYRGPQFNLHASSLSDKWVDLGDEGISTWGYLRVPSDTSKSYEIKKYLIELELMQTR